VTINKERLLDTAAGLSRAAAARSSVRDDTLPTQPRRRAVQRGSCRHTKRERERETEDAGAVPRTSTVPLWSRAILRM
jgi:hypothetical protein